MARFDDLFGFDLIQKQTLRKLLADLVLTPEQVAALEAVAALPTTEPAAGGVWNDGGVLKAALE